MGLSGATGTVNTSGGALAGQVTKWNATETAYKKEFGHDKSAGWQDVCYGIKKLSGTIDLILVGPAQFYAGQKVSISLVPDNMQCVGPLTGVAGIDSVSYSVNIETGEPNSATISFSSIGAWTGLPGDGEQWGGFEDNCDGT